MLPGSTPLHRRCGESPERRGAELSTRLRVDWTAVDENGIAEIVGVPQVLIEQWSARRHELKAVGDEIIARRAVELGRSLSPNERAECFQIAAYRTRTPKVDAETSTEELSRLVSGADAEEVRERAEVLADRVLADVEVVSLAAPLPAEPPALLRRRDGMSAIERHGAARFTTRATLRREAAILEGVDAGRDAHVAVVDAAVREVPSAGPAARAPDRAWQLRDAARGAGRRSQVGNSQSPIKSPCRHPVGKG